VLKTQICVTRPQCVKIIIIIMIIIIIIIIIIINAHNLSKISIYFIPHNSVCIKTHRKNQ